MFAFKAIYIQANCLYILKIICHLNQWHYEKIELISQYLIADKLISLMTNKLTNLMPLMTKNGRYLKNIKVNYLSMPDSSMWVI